jgi:hypothetical protein
MKMKTLVVITVFMLCILQASLAQTDSITPRKIYKTWIKPFGEHHETKGVLFEIMDSSVVVSNSLNKTDYYQGKYDVSKVDIRNIDVVKMRKKNNIGKGILIGGVSGATVGGIIGVIGWKRSHNNAWQEAGNAINNGLIVTVGILTTITGFFIGAVIGSARTKIQVHGSQKQFEENKSLLNDYSVKYNPRLAGQTFSKLHEMLVDIDGNFYPTIALGAQVWMAEDLKVSHYRDGSDIPDSTNNIPGIQHKYNWTEVTDKRKLCPVGWHVPTLEDWTSLFNSLGGRRIAGNKMEQAFSSRDKTGQWWSTTEKDSSNVHGIYLQGRTAEVIFPGKTKYTRLSVRCIRDY